MPRGLAARGQARKEHLQLRQGSSHFDTAVELCQQQHPCEAKTILVLYPGDYCSEANQTTAEPRPNQLCWNVGIRRGAPALPIREFVRCTRGEPQRIDPDTKPERLQGYGRGSAGPVHVYSPSSCSRARRVSFEATASGALHTQPAARRRPSSARALVRLDCGPRPAPGRDDPRSGRAGRLRSHCHEEWR